MSEIDKDFAFLYGVMLGDGCLSLVYDRKKFVSITGSSKDDLEFFEEVLKPIVEKFRKKEAKIKFRKSCNAIDFNFTSNILFDRLHGVGFPIGKKMDRLFIPKIFYEKGLVNEVISGFFATDGCLVITKNCNKLYPRVEANGIAKSLITEINNYLNGLGIKCNLYHAKRKDSMGYTKISDQDRLQINGEIQTRIFNEKIGFSNSKHKLKFIKIMNYLEKYSEKILSPKSSS